MTWTVDFGYFRSVVIQSAVRLSGCQQMVAKICLQNFPKVRFAHWGQILLIPVMIQLGPSAHHSHMKTSYLVLKNKLFNTRC